MTSSVNEKNLEYFEQLPRLGNRPLSESEVELGKSVLKHFSGHEHTLRSTALSRLNDIGFPGPKSEAQSLIANTRRADINQLLAYTNNRSANCEEIVQTILKVLPKGISAHTNEQWMEKYPHALSMLQQQLQTENDSIRLCEYLSTSATIHMSTDAGLQIEPSILLELAKIESQPFHLVLWLAESSHSTWEIDLTPASQSAHSHYGLTIILDRKANANFNLLQKKSENQVWNSIRYILYGNSKAKSVHFAQGASLAHLSIDAVLCEEGADFSWNSANLLRSSLGYQYVRVAHQKPHTYSQQQFRNILDGNARHGVDTAIGVYPNAQQITAKQQIHHLLLSNSVKADTKPQLMIFADDVKCSHGATTGQLDPEQLFYLSSRGLSLTEATALLTRSYMAPILAECENASWRKKIEDLIQNSLTT